MIIQLPETLMQEIDEVFRKHRLGFVIRNIQINDNGMYNHNPQDWPKETKKTPEMRGSLDFTIFFQKD